MKCAPAAFILSQEEIDFDLMSCWPSGISRTWIFTTGMITSYLDFCTLKKENFKKLAIVLVEFYASFFKGKNSYAHS